MYSATIGIRRYTFPDLRTLLAKASPLRSGDQLAGLAAGSGEERVAAQFALADLPLRTFLMNTSSATTAMKSQDSSSILTTKRPSQPLRI